LGAKVPTSISEEKTDNQGLVTLNPCLFSYSRKKRIRNCMALLWVFCEPNERQFKQIITLLLLKSSFEFMEMKEKCEHPDFMPVIKDYFASVRRVLSSLIKNKTFMILNWVYL